MKLMRIGVDLAKNVFQIHGVDRHEKPVWRQRLSRDQWLQTVLEKIEPGCEIGLDFTAESTHLRLNCSGLRFHVAARKKKSFQPTASRQFRRSDFVNRIRRFLPVENYEFLAGLKIEFRGDSLK